MCSSDLGSRILEAGAVGAHSGRLVAQPALQGPQGGVDEPPALLVGAAALDPVEAGGVDEAEVAPQGAH